MITPKGLLAGLDETSYFYLEIRAKELTLEGLRKQRECLESDSCSEENLIRITEDTQAKITKLYQEAGSTPAQAAAYYTTHRTSLDMLYKEGTYAQRLQELQRAIEEEDARINTLRGGAQ